MQAGLIDKWLKDIVEVYYQERKAKASTDDLFNTESISSDGKVNI